MAEEHAGHRQRMRQRFAQGGLAGFAQHEMLELLLFYAIPQRNVNPLAHRLIAQFGSLAGVMNATQQELCQVEGMGPYAAALIALVHQLSREEERARQHQRPQLRNRTQTRQHCESLLRGLREEHLYAVCLNAKNEVLENALIGRGTASQVEANPREVAKQVLRTNARMVVLCHNHPGGTTEPSMQDLDMTRELGTMLAGLDIILADHIIVGESTSLSLFEAGLLTHASAGDGSAW